jgi:MFS family permease
MHKVGAAWLMTALAPSPLLVSLLQTAANLPIFLLGLLAGALADIVDRRTLLLFAQSWMAIAAACLGILTLFGLTTPWLLLGFTFVLGIGAALNMPAWQAITPELVSREELAAAALGGISFNAARTIGPALGGLVVAAMGPWAVFILNAISFVGVIVVLYGFERPPRQNALLSERFLGAIQAGLRYLRHAPALRTTIIEGPSVHLLWQRGLGVAAAGCPARAEIDLTRLRPLDGVSGIRRGPRSERLAKDAQAI